MKKNVLKIFVLGFILIAMSSFDSNSFKTHNIDLSKINQYKIDKLLEIKKADEQKLAYRLINSESRFSIWKNRLENLINENRLGNDVVSLTSEQKKLLIEIYNKMDADIFSNEIKNDKREYLKVVYFRDFLKRTENVFTDLQLTSIFSRIDSNIDNHGFNKVKDISLADLIKLNIANAEDCECNPIVVAISDCDDDEECTKTTSCDLWLGCGIWWLDYCNGLCG